MRFGGITNFAEVTTFLERVPPAKAQDVYVARIDSFGYDPKEQSRQHNLVFSLALDMFGQVRIRCRNVTARPTSNLASPTKVMRLVQDKYFNLRPPLPTPPEEICSCPGFPPIKVMYALSYNPLHCMNCNLEVDPTTLGLSSELAEAIAYWRSMYGAIDALWLASGEYEEWALTQLSDVSNPLNREGREIQTDLNLIRRCYYWYFQDQSADDYEPLAACPSCGAQLTLYDAGIFEQRICDVCSIVVPGSLK
jgi:hypothetical protein